MCLYRPGNYQVFKCIRLSNNKSPKSWQMWFGQNTKYQIHHLFYLWVSIMISKILGQCWKQNRSPYSLKLFPSRKTVELQAANSPEKLLVLGHWILKVRNLKQKFKSLKERNIRIPKVYLFLNPKTKRKFWTDSEN